MPQDQKRSLQAAKGKLSSAMRTRQAIPDAAFPTSAFQRVNGVDGGLQGEVISPQCLDEYATCLSTSAKAVLEISSLPTSS